MNWPGVRLVSAVPVGLTATFAATIRVKLLGTVVVPVGVPVTEMLKLPYVAEAGAFTVKMLALPTNVGINRRGLKEQEKPVGSVALMQDRLTTSPLTLRRVAIMVLKPEPPGTSVMPPELESE